MSVLRLKRRVSSQAGFSLLEVLIALVVISIGLLGIAKMQALAYSSTTTARLRSLAAIAGSSLASAMHTNRNYWSAGAAPVSTTITTTAGTTSISDSTLSATVDCTSACTGDQLAAYDVQSWAVSLRGTLPNAGATITCPKLPTPITCSVVITWSDKTVAINKQATSATETSSYQLFVEP